MADRITKIRQSNLFIVETILGLMCAAAINAYFFPKSPAFANINPNPLWIIVIGIAARYGRKGALFAGFATAALFVGYYLVLSGIDAFYDDAWLLVGPFLFILIGFLIGEVKTAFILREDYLTTRVTELENLNTNLTHENEIVKQAHRDLSGNVATNQDTITTLNEIMTKIKSTSPDDIIRGLLEGIEGHLGANECSFYAFEGNLLTLKKSIGWKDYYRRPETYERGQGLIGLALKEKKVFSIKDTLSNKSSPRVTTDFVGDSMIAIPVEDAADVLYGVASIEKIPFEKLTDATIQTAKIFASLTASALSSAYNLMALERKQIKDEHFGTYKYHFFISRLEEEFKRSRSYMLPLSIIYFRWPSLMSLDEKKRVVVLESISQLIKTHLREFDILSTGPSPSAPFILLMATTSRPQAEELKGKITQRLKEYSFDKILSNADAGNSIEIIDYNPNKMSSYKDMLRVIGL